MSGQLIELQIVIPVCSITEVYLISSGKNMTDGSTKVLYLLMSGSVSGTYFGLKHS